ncbi:OmpA family protein [Methylovulum miyakonense]|uniref:OmpA family protein n=1 Tax=Methylovulum miyakonense TaxID=645578 RepID=UPI00036801FA|nr:OmpA family protein [Methylovulum miyakonense]
MKKSHLLALATLTSVSMMSIAQADELVDNRWYVAPFGSYIHTGGDRGAEDGWGAGMGVGKMLDKHFNVEIRGFYQEYDANPVGEWKNGGGTVDLQYYFSRNKLAPYTVIGAGGMATSAGGVSRNGSFIGEAGAGLAYEINDNFLLRGDVRYRYNNNFDTTYGRNTDEFHDMVVNVGFVVPFGPKPTAPVAFEMPAPAPVVKAPDCSTLDSDSDGVNDCLDKCPATIAGSKVDFEGCPISLELKGVNFKLDSAELTVNAMSILDSVAASLMGYPEKDDIEVRGHTSSEASDAYNMRLSQRRSQSVVNYLKMKGVTNRLTARGFGESQPIADNATEEGRSLNRRVELIWMGK